MSIDAVETNPEGPDVVHIADPGTDAVAEPHHGTDTLDSITHIPPAQNRTTEHPSFAGMPFGRRARGGRGHQLPDVAEVLTGDQNDARDVRDDAVQTRQLLPTAWDTRSYPLAGAASVQIVAERPERMSLALYNVGPATVYVGPSQGKGTGNGFPIPAGASLTVNQTGQVWACIDTGTGASADLRVTEQWRTDNTGN